jgi:hypothetical protein
MFFLLNDGDGSQGWVYLEENPVIMFKPAASSIVYAAAGAFFGTIMG